MIYVCLFLSKNKAFAVELFACGAECSYIVGRQQTRLGQMGQSGAGRTH